MEKNIKVGKRKFNNNRRQNYLQQQQRAILSLSPKEKRQALGALFVTFIIFLLFILKRTDQSANSQKKLRDQLSYVSHNRTCTATLCNPLNRCSTWSANQIYDWSTLSQAGLFRDLATAQVSLGCELRIKVEDRVRGGEWLSLYDGFTECSDSGYGRKCRNLVEIDLKANALILAKQLKSVIMTEEEHSKEVVMSQQGITQNTKDVTLVSQFTVNRLGVFANVIRGWEGPISIAIYLTQPSDIDVLIEYLQDPDHLVLYSRVTLSLVKPDFLSSAYPINHLRNIAIVESTTDYVFVIDADFMPSIHLYSHIQSKLLPFLTRKNAPSNTAWVVPCFAMHEEYNDIPQPETLDELKKLVANQIAYITDPGAGHGPTLALEMALSRPFSIGNALAYEVCYESQWEPYYIVHRSAPLYDCRFRNQGGDKQSHALHLNAERYRFMVLRESFVIHRDHSKMVWPGGGFEKSQKEPTKWNYFEGYIDEIESLYGKWARWPRGCSASAIGWQDQRRNTLGWATGAI